MVHAHAQRKRKLPITQTRDRQTEHSEEMVQVKDTVPVQTSEICLILKSTNICYNARVSTTTPQSTNRFKEGAQ